MSLSTVFAVLFSALLHATWNSLAHNVSDRLVGFALIGVVDAVVGGAMAAIAGMPPAGAWPYLVASAVLHVAYNLLLLASYQLGEFSQMYPLARGTSPWVVALISVVVLGRGLPIAELAGVAAVSGGLIALVFVGGRPGRRDLRAIAAAVHDADTVDHRVRGDRQTGPAAPGGGSWRGGSGDRGRHHRDRRVHHRAVGPDQRRAGAYRGTA